MLPRPPFRRFSPPQVFADDERLAGALLDRLTHHVHILELIGDSYRLKESLNKDKEKQG